jgi:hypothetical protein
MLAGLEVVRAEVAGRSLGSRTLVVTHPRRKPSLYRRDPTLLICRVYAGASAGHRRGGYVLVAVDEEGIRLPAANRTHCAASLVVDDMPDGNVCFTLHIDAPNRGIIDPLRWR